MRPFRLGLIVAIVLCIFLISQFLLENLLEEDTTWQNFNMQANLEETHLYREMTVPVVLWWEPVGGLGVNGSGKLKSCHEHSCFFTHDRSFQHHSQTKVLMFYGSNINLMDLPLPRAPSVLWAVLHEESPRNLGPLSHLAALSLFNYTATFSRHSSFPLTTQYLSSLQALKDVKYLVSNEEKNRLQTSEGLAPVMYMQSDCSTMADRDSYVVELAKYIKVDSYGACLHNKDLPLPLQPPHALDTMMDEELFHLVAKYKFTLAFENGVCQDYITEKLWRPLICGSLPVYFGSPSVMDWLPNNKSAVLVSDFKSPKDLAEYLLYLNKNDEEYNRYLSHKLKAEVQNARLIQTMKEREWDIDWRTDKPDYIESFECFVCKKLHNGREESVATTEHYLCPPPKSMVSSRYNRSNFWLDNWFYSRCEAQILRGFVDSKVGSFSKQQFQDALEPLVLKRECQYSEEIVRTGD